MNTFSHLLSSLLLLLCLLFSIGHAFNIVDYTHYIDYLPVRQEGLAAFEDFRTSLSPPSALRNRKMEIGQLQVSHTYLVSI